MNRILIVDDQLAIHEDFRKVLMPSTTSMASLSADAALLFGEELPTSYPAAPTFDLDFCTSGQDALAKVEQALQEGRPYQVAFVDIRMPPGWDGIETLTHLWKADPELQAVICSAYSDYSWSRISDKLQHPGSLLSLKKPFDAMEAQQMATLLCEKWHTARSETAHRTHLDRLLAAKTTEAMEAERARADSDSRLAIAFDHSPTALAIIDAVHLNWTTLNKAFLKLTGWTSHAEPVEDFFSEQQDLTRKLLNTQETIKELHVRIHSVHGQKDVLLSRDFCMVNQHLQLMLSLTDITEQTETAHRLRQAQKMEAVGQLAAGVAHDFNNIMTVILGRVSTILADEALPTTVRESLQETMTAGNRAAVLTKQLLAFGRKQVMQISPLCPTTSIPHNAAILSRLIGEHITIQTSIPAELPWFMADANSLNQVILNLGINARDAMTSGGNIHISGDVIHFTAATRQHKEGRYLRISFRDTGTGMDEDTRSHLFEPFFTTKPVGQGTGLGLSTVHGIMAQHGGWVECESSLGSGATFHLYFPAIDAPANTAKTATVPLPIAKQSTTYGNGHTILVVEDEAPIRSMLCAILKRFGFHVHEACDAAAALEVWKQNAHTIDALFTDIVMPGNMSGVILARALMNEKPELKVVLSSGYSPDLLRDADSLEQFNSYLPKPYDLHSVSKVLKNVFEPHAA